MEKHYEFTEEVVQHYDAVLHRIRATKDLPNGVKKGDLGGFVESFDNLSGNAWVYGNAKVYENARVYGYATVCENAMVYGKAEVYNNAWISGDGRVYGEALVCCNAKVYGDAKIHGNALVYGDAEVHGNAEVYNDAEVYSNAQVYGDARVYDNSKVYGDTKVFGNARVYGYAEVSGKALVSGDFDNETNIDTELKGEFINNTQKLRTAIAEAARNQGSMNKHFSALLGTVEGLKLSPEVVLPIFSDCSELQSSLTRLWELSSTK